MKDLLKYLDSFLVEGKRTKPYFEEMALQIIYLVAKNPNKLNDLSLLDTKSQIYLKKIISEPCISVDNVPFKPLAKVSKEFYEKQFLGVQLLKKHYKMDS